MTYILHNVHGSNIANLMIKYIFATKVIRTLGDGVLSNYCLPVWNISHPPADNKEEVAIDFLEDQRINFERLAYLVRTRIVTRINLHGHLQRMENLLECSESRMLFRTEKDVGISFGSEFVVCPIRGGEILKAIHPGYTLVPIAFYRDIFSMLGSGVRPVFMGQLGDNLYSCALRKEFKEALFVPAQTPLADFETIRKSKNIVLSVSTFSWLAAWLSNAANIFMPVYGLFNPAQFQDHDFLPISDPRYTFFSFPVHHAVDVDKFAKAHAELAWNSVEPKSLVRI